MEPARTITARDVMKGYYNMNFIVEIQYTPETDDSVERLSFSCPKIAADFAKRQRKAANVISAVIIPDNRVGQLSFKMEEI